MSFTLVGCATPQYNYQATPKNISKPPIGTINEAMVGDKLLEQGIVVDREALYINERKTGLGGVYVNQGYYLKIGEDKSGSFYQGINNIPNGGSINSPNVGLYMNEFGEVCIVTAFLSKSCKLDLKGVKKKINIANDNSFQQTLIYSGKVGNKINIGYREFSSNLARPAFNNDVEYDLNESKQIGYKGALIEVIDATNQGIKYKVLRNFNITE